MVCINMSRWFSTDYDEGKPEDEEAVHTTPSSGYFNSHISEQQDKSFKSIAVEKQFLAAFIWYTWYEEDKLDIMVCINMSRWFSTDYDEGKPEDEEAVHTTPSSGYFNSHISEQQDKSNGTGWGNKF